MPEPSYDRWVFDLDGTLVDVEPAYVRETFDRVGDRLGYEFTDSEAEAIWHGLGGFRNDLLGARGVDVDAFWEIFHDEENPQARAEATYLYDDAAVVGELEAPTGDGAGERNARLGATVGVGVGTDHVEVGVCVAVAVHRRLSRRPHAERIRGPVRRSLHGAVYT